MFHCFSNGVHIDEWNSAYNMPFRAMGKMAGGMVSEKMVDDIVFLVNGHFFRGLSRVIRDFFRNMSRNKAFMKTLEANKEG